MSRHPDFEIVENNPSAILADMVSRYEEITGTALNPADPETLILRWAASFISHERALLNYAANQNIPSRAEGENLDALAELFFAQKRVPAQPAKCTVRFYISLVRQSATLIPKSTRVTDESQTFYWETSADAYIKAGETYIDLPVICMSPGLSGNGFLPGQINTAVDIYHYYSGCENITESDGGTDEMTDDELYEAMRLSMDALSTAGARECYIYHAKSVSTEISDVAVISPAPGQVRIFVLMKDGSPAGEEIKKQIFDACNADYVRPLTDEVQTADPLPYSYQISFTYWLPADTTMSSGDFETVVQNVVDDYILWQSAKFGRDINPSKLVSMLMQAGVARVELTTPLYYKLSAGRDGENDLNYRPEYAKFSGPARIVCGGIADESS